MAALKTVTIRPPFRGLHTVAPPGDLPNATAPVFKNFLPEYQNKVSMRGPLRGENTINVAGETFSHPIITGTWSSGSKVLIGIMEKGETSKKYLPPWVAPYISATAENQLALRYKYVLVYDFATNTTTKTETSGQYVTPCGRGAKLGKYVFGFGFGWEATDTTYNRQGLTKMIKWDGTTSVPTVVNSAPLGGQAVKSYLNRIFSLGGRMPGSGEYGTRVGKAYPSSHKEDTQLYFSYKGGSYPSNEGLYEWLGAAPARGVGMTITGTGIKAETVVESVHIYVVGFEIVGTYVKPSKTTSAEVPVGTEITFGTPVTEISPSGLTWTIEGGPISGEVADWQDEVTGLINQIVVGSDDQGDFGVALAQVNQSLIIFKRHSIWGLYGTSPETFSLRNITKERGCVDPWSVCEVDGGVYFLSQNGIEFFNGSEFVSIDTPINNITQPLQGYLTGEAGERASAVTVLGRCSMVYLGQDYVFVSFAYQEAKEGTLPTQTNSLPIWSGMVHVPTGQWTQFTSSIVEQPQLVGRTNGIPWVYDGSRIYRMPYLTSPQLADIDGFPQCDTNTSGTKFAIPAEYITDRVNLTAPGFRTQLHRIMQDHKFPNGANDAAGKSNGWKLSVLDAKTGQVAFTETLLPGQGALGYLDSIYGPGLGSGTEFMSGRRYSVDAFAELADARVKIRLPAGEISYEPKGCEIYTTTLEVQDPTHQKREV